jgi:hypothetical protein
MHIKIRNKIAVIEFEKDNNGCGHAEIMKDIIRHLDDGFKKFVFDFKWVDISFNSGVSGFLIVTVKKLIEAEAVVVLKNINDQDMGLLKLVGLLDVDSSGKKIIYRSEEADS